MVKQQVWTDILNSNLVDYDKWNRPFFKNYNYDIPKQDDTIICLYEEGQEFKVRAFYNAKVDVLDSNNVLRTFHLNSVIKIQEIKKIIKGNITKDKLINEKCKLESGEYFIVHKKEKKHNGLFVCNYKCVPIDDVVKRSIGDIKLYYKIETLTTKDIDISDFQKYNKNIIKAWKFLVNKL